MSTYWGRPIESIEQLERCCHYETAEAIASGIHRAQETGIYTKGNDFEKHVLQVANSVGHVSLERFFENSSKHMGEAWFDFDKYAELFLAAHKEFGHLTGDYFSLRYIAALERGLQPEEYYNHVRRAVEEGGKRFGSLYAYVLPEVLGEGVKAGDFMDEMLAVYLTGRLRVLKPYALNAAHMQRMGVETYNFAQISEWAAEQFGKETASWIIMNIPHAVKAGYNPSRFLLQCTKMSRKGGEQAAKWYASWLGGLLKIKEKISEHHRKTEELVTRFKDPEFHDALDFWEDMEQNFDPLKYKENYSAVLDSAGQSAATAYTLLLPKVYYCGDHEKLKSQLRTYCEELPERFAGFKKSVSKKVFSSAMWFLPKISYVENAVAMLDSIETATKKLDDKKVVEAIKYTYGCAKRGATSWVLVFPGGHIDMETDPVAEGWEPWFGGADDYEDWENYPF